MERYEPVRDLGKGNFGVAKLMRDRVTGELVAIKFIERGERVDRNVEREICNHRMLNHPNIVGFKEVFLTPSHLGIVMEYAAGGELFERIVRAGRFGEDEARYFFQQLISGVDYCHASGVCHRDLKLENTLLDGNPAPRLKICDFGYSKSAFDSQPKSTVGTPAYIAPEVLQRKEYNGQPADVWSCGVTLYVMLVGAYPFEDPADPRNFRKTIQRIMNVKFSFPSAMAISAECQDLISRIFVSSPQHRITIAEIRRHPWFLKNLPAELANPDNYTRNPEPHQSLDEIRDLIRAARGLGDALGGHSLGHAAAHAHLAGGGSKTSLPLEFNEDDYMDNDIAGDPSLGLGMGAMGMGMGGGSSSSTGGSGGAMVGGAGGMAGGAFLLADNGYPMAHPGAGPSGAAHLGLPMGVVGVGGMGMGMGMGAHPAAGSPMGVSHMHAVHAAAGHGAGHGGAAALAAVQHQQAAAAQAQKQKQAAAVAAAAAAEYGMAMGHIGGAGGGGQGGGYAMGVGQPQFHIGAGGYGQVAATARGGYGPQVMGRGGYTQQQLQQLLLQQQQQLQLQHQQQQHMQHGGHHQGMPR